MSLIPVRSFHDLTLSRLCRPGLCASTVIRKRAAGIVERRATGFLNPSTKMGSDLLHGEVLVGFAVSLTAIAIHSVMMAVLVWTAHRTSHLTRAAHARLRLIVLMWATVTVLMFAHLSEVLVWGLVYELLGAVPHG